VNRNIQNSQISYTSWTLSYSYYIGHRTAREYTYIPPIHCTHVRDAMAVDWIFTKYNVRKVYVSRVISSPVLSIDARVECVVDVCCAAERLSASRGGCAGRRRRSVTTRCAPHYYYRRVILYYNSMPIIIIFFLQEIRPRMGLSISEVARIYIIASRATAVVVSPSARQLQRIPITIFTDDAYYSSCQACTGVTFRNNIMFVVFMDCAVAILLSDL